MKRFKVQTADGHTLLLYYPTQEKAQESYPDATITEHTDQSHVELSLIHISEPTRRS